MSIVFEKNVPAPNYSYRPNKKYNWEEMEVGDSFVVNGKAERNIIKSSFYAFQKNHPDSPHVDRVLISRTMKDGTIRFWLVDKE